MFALSGELQPHASNDDNAHPTIAIARTTGFDGVWGIDGCTFGATAARRYAEE